MAKEQLYPGLRANNVQGYYEFSDFPMLGPDDAHLNIKEKEILTGETVHAYIYEYAKHFDLLRRMLKRRGRWRFRLGRARRQSPARNSWSRLDKPPNPLFHPS